MPKRKLYNNGNVEPWWIQQTRKDNVPYSKIIKEEIRRRLYNNLYPKDYTGDFGSIFERLYNSVIKNKKEDGMTGVDYAGFRPLRDDIFAEYLGIPKSNRHRIKGKTLLEQSTNVPTKSKKQSKYYKIPWNTNSEIAYILPFDSTDVNNSHILGTAPLSETFINNIANESLWLNDNIYPKIGDNRVSSALSMYFGDHTLGSGYDKNKGHYLSYYDLWDLNPNYGQYGGRDRGLFPKLINTKGDISRGLGKPLEFYDRLYLDDYYGVKGNSHNIYLPEVKIYGKRKKNTHKK